MGLTASLSPSWGLASGGVGELWSRPDTRGLAGGSDLPQPLGRMDAELGYGLAVLNGQGILTPYARAALSEGADQAWHLGTRLSLRESLDLSLEATRRQRRRDTAAHELPSWQPCRGKPLFRLPEHPATRQAGAFAMTAGAAAAPPSWCRRYPAISSCHTDETTAPEGA